MLAPLLIGIGFQAITSPGTVISTSLLGELSLAQTRQAVLTSYRSPKNRPVVTHGVKIYRVVYWSEDTQNRPIKLAGCVIFPTQKQTKGLVLFCHGTIADRDNVPSRLTMDGKVNPEAWVSMLAFAGGGYAYCAPDYLGLGIDKGAHPFARSVNSMASRDLIRGARSIASKQGFNFKNRLYVTGYSEGSGIAMWTTRSLLAEPDPSLHPNAAALMAGPFDMSHTMAQHVISKPKTAIDTAIRAYFMAFFAYGARQDYPEFEMEDMFVPTFAKAVVPIFDKAGKETVVQRNIALKAVQVGGLLGMKRIMQPTVFAALKNGDASNPAVQILKDNDCYDWSPTCPMYLTGYVNDNIVPFRNTEVAVRTMRARGISRKQLGYHKITEKGLDHVKAFAPSIALARLYLDKGLAGVPTDPDPKK